MNSSKDWALNGFRRTSILSPAPNPAFSNSGEMSDMSFQERFRSSDSVRPINRETSDISFSKRFRTVSPASGSRSEVLLPWRYSSFSDVRPDSAEISDTSFLK